MFQDGLRSIILHIETQLWKQSSSCIISLALTKTTVIRFRVSAGVVECSHSWLQATRGRFILRTICPKYSLTFTPLNPAKHVPLSGKSLK